MKHTAPQDREVSWRLRLGLAALLPITWAVQSWARSEPVFVERVYSERLYPIFGEIVGTLTGWVTYSIAELTIVALLGYLVYRVVRTVRGLVRRQRTLRNALAHALSFTLAAAGVLYAWGTFGWALNYHRQSFLRVENLDRVGITAEELRAVSLDLAARCNELRRTLSEDDDGVLRLLESDRDALARGTKAYKAMELEYASLRDGFVSPPKGLILPVLPWLFVSGVFSPFTMEPNVSLEQPPHDMLFAGCHEMAHQLGWAREQEANFVGYAACRRHPDEDYRYAAAHAALSYTLAALRHVDQDAAAAVGVTLSPGVQRDFDASRAFWQRHDTGVAEAAQKVNDAYLKSQGQEEGVASYGMMVDLLVADYRRKKP